MTTNDTTTPEPATTAPDTNEPATPTPSARTAGEWLIGDHYDSTADMPMTQIVETVMMDLYQVRNDDMLPAIAEFEVGVDSHDPVPVIKVCITGLIDATAFPGTSSTVYEAMRTAFDLANHYNRVNLARPGQARFIQHITALRPDGTPGVVLVGMMHEAVTA